MKTDKHARDLAKSKKEYKEVASWFDEGVRVSIMSLHHYFTAYLGIPVSHPLAGFDYDDLSLGVHGGLTYSRKGDGDYLPKGYWWYGWDYAHAGDAVYYGGDDFCIGDHDWTLEEVKGEVQDALYEFKRLVNLAEKITNKVLESK